MKKMLYSIGTLVVFGVGLFLFSRTRPAIAPAITPATQAPIPARTPSTDIVVEEVVGELEVPWSIVFTDAERMLVSERPGRIRIIENNKLVKRPLATFDEVSSQDEEGLMGLALDPNYRENKQVYACIAYPKDEGLVDKVISFIDEGTSISNQTTILDNIPAGRFHAGCRLAFGPDGLLYITTGDATDKEIAQDSKSLGGKILRIGADGSIPQDNPFPNSPIWTLGHRNPQGIGWHPTTGALLESEHGPSGFDGPLGGDEINEIIKGENYGWPRVSHEKTDPQFATPLVVYTPAVAPGSGTFYDGTILTQFTNHFLFGGLKGEGVYDVELTDEAPHTVVSQGVIPQTAKYGRIRDVATGPDGYIYFSTSNRDGRGDTPHPQDDKILRILPQP